jgi:hypothetical protein
MFEVRYRSCDTTNVRDETLKQLLMLNGKLKNIKYETVVVPPKDIDYCWKAFIKLTSNGNDEIIEESRFISVFWIG